MAPENMQFAYDAAIYIRSPILDTDIPLITANKVYIWIRSSLYMKVWRHRVSFSGRSINLLTTSSTLAVHAR